MANKILLTWNIRPGHEREHFQRIRKFVSDLGALGLDLQDGWYTVYGDAPQILLGIVAPGGGDDKLEKALTSREWATLVDELKQYVTDYRQRIVIATGQFQL
jgi:hypothetical protein